MLRRIAPAVALAAALSGVLAGQEPEVSNLEHPLHTALPATDAARVTNREQVFRARPPRIPASTDHARERLDALLESASPTTITADQIVALGRDAAALDAKARRSACELLDRTAEVREVRRDLFTEQAVDAALDPLSEGGLDCAFAIADQFLAFGPHPDAETLRTALEHGDVIAQLTALYLVADRPAIAVQLQPAVAELAAGRRDGPWRVFDDAIRIAASRALLRTPADVAARTDALKVMLDSTDAVDRIDALRIAAGDGPGARPLLRRVIHRLRAASDAETTAALTALGSIGLPPRAQWIEKADLFRVLMRSQDAAACTAAREELSWPGPWLSDALPRVAALADDRSRPGIARLAAAVHAQLSAELAAAADRDR